MTSKAAYDGSPGDAAAPREACLRIGSLCSGYGGLDLGLTAVTGGSVAWHVEYDEHPSAVLEARFPRVPNYGDVKATDWTAVEPVDWLTAGYPCQPFSDIGQKRGADDPRHLFPHVAEAIRVLRPGHVLLENVGGHLRRGFTDVLGALADLRYDCRWGVFRASAAGAPHHRDRLFVVAWDATGIARDAAPPAARGDGASARRSSQPPRRPDSDFAWGPYIAAIRRWEAVLGRLAPNPVERRPDGVEVVSARFTEWLMGLPAGWVTDVLPHEPAMKALGNGVVPQQATLAVRALLGAEAVAA